MNDKPKGKRGFASMSPERQREIARAGGKAAHAQGRAHQFTSAEAKAAGRKGAAGLAASKKWIADQLADASEE